MLFRASAESKGTHDVHPCGNPISHSAKLADTTRSLCHSDGDVFSANSGSKRRHDGNSNLFLRVRISAAMCVVGKQRIVPYTRSVGSLSGCTTALCLGVANVSAKGTCFKCIFRGSNFSISGSLRCCKWDRLPLQLPKAGMRAVEPCDVFFLTRPLLRRWFPAASASVALSESSAMP